jgi:hypothetical protein
MKTVNSVEEFDKLLTETVNETLEYTLGERNAAIIEDYMEKKGLPLNKIPQNPQQFSEELRNIMSSTQMLGPVNVLEETILKLLGRKIGKRVAVMRPIDFSKEVNSLREPYLK